ncbi:MAG: hypothetical protein EAZ55_08800 [Cytophagales bacterium]|nr:MAG: hypothetical protein EAZ55_08800 [Cytophagales bacterium]
MLAQETQLLQEPMQEFVWEINSIKKESKIVTKKDSFVMAELELLRKELSELRNLYEQLLWQQNFDNIENFDIALCV